MQPRRGGEKSWLDATAIWALRQWDEGRHHRWEEKVPNPRGISKAARDFLWRWELDSSVHPKIWSLNDWEDDCNSKGREGRGKWRTDQGRGTFIWEHFFPDVGKGKRRKREKS